MGAGAPHVLHYAWKLAVPGHAWTFNKHNHNRFTVNTCPPWTAQPGVRGLFPHPPLPSLLQSKVLIPSRRTSTLSPYYI